MLSPTEERIIARAARAQQAYWQLVKRFSDDARRRLALMSRYIEIQHELRGDERPRFDGAEPVDCWIPLERVVDRELERRRPLIRAEVSVARETRRLAVNCGYVSLALSSVARARRKLRRIIHDSGLSIREVAEALGVATSTLDRHLAGTRPTAKRVDWYHRLQAIAIDDETIHIVIKRAPPTRKKFGWRKPLVDDDSDADRGDE